MAELLQALLTKQRRRNPYSDLMGPDPLESQAIMDAAQGSDVSIPSPVSGGAPMADAGSGILLASGGGGGGRVRSAGYSEDDDEPRSPIRTAAGSGARASATTQTQCKPGMKCYRGGTTVGSGQQFFSQPQMMGERVTHINGVPVGQMGGGSIVTGTPMATTVMDGGAYSSGGSLTDPQSMFDSAMEAEYSGDPSRRALNEKGIGYGLAIRQQDENALNSAHNRSMAESARQYAFAQQEMEKAKLDEEIANLAAERALTAEQTQLTRESTSMGLYDDRRAAVAAMLRTGGNPEDLANYLAATASGPRELKSDSKGKPLPGEPGNAAAVEAMVEARAQAYSAAAIHGLATSQRVLQAARGLDVTGDAVIVSRLDGESDEEYRARARESLDALNAEALPRAAETIISGLQRTPAWKNNDRLEVQRYLDAHLYYPLQRHLRQEFMAQRQGSLKGLSPERRDAAEREIMAQADYTTNSISEFFKVEVEAAMDDPKYRDDDTYLNNMWRAWFGGDAAPPQDTPADSNNTMPDLPAMPGYP
jgi:hypothetical protein